MVFLIQSLENACARVHVWAKVQCSHYYCDCRGFEQNELLLVVVFE